MTRFVARPCTRRHAIQGALFQRRAFGARSKDIGVMERLFCESVMISPGHIVILINLSNTAQIMQKVSINAPMFNSCVVNTWVHLLI